MALALWTDRGTVLSSNLPADTGTVFGQSGLTFPDEGNILRVVSGTGINPGGLGADNVLAVFTIPANSFDIAGRGLNFLAMGSFANNANSKQVRIIFNPVTAVVGSTVGTGGTIIADTGAYTTALNAAWQIEANVFKYGVTGSNTQLGIHQSAQIAAIVSALIVPNAMTAVESGPILVAITGNAATATTNISLNFFEVNAMN
jgi:hypothetical protein